MTNIIYWYKEAHKKPFRTKFRTVNLERDCLLKESISKSKTNANSDICIFNPNSYLNLKIVKEADVAYLDEAY